MNKYLLRRENVLLITVNFCVILNKFFIGESVLDIHVHDTYFIIEGLFSSFIIILYTLLIYVLYISLRRKNKMPSNIISFIQIMGLILFSLNDILKFSYSSIIGMPRRYYDYSDSIKTFGIIDNTTNLFVFCFMLSQLLFLLYFLIVLGKQFLKNP